MLGSEAGRAAGSIERQGFVGAQEHFLAARRAPEAPGAAAATAPPRGDRLTIRRSGAARGLATVAVALVALTISQDATARVGTDPCGEANGASVQSVGTTLVRVCNSVYTVPAHRTHSVPEIGRRLECPKGFKVNGVGSGANELNLAPVRAHWDFWSYRSEWVTWNGLLIADPRKIDGEYWAVGIRSFLHNWWGGGGWDVRVYHYCSRIPTARGADVFRASSAMEDSEPFGEENSFEEGGRGDDEFRGAKGGDQYLGGPGDDSSNGGDGRDQLFGGAGDDIADGGHGSDELFDDQGNDELIGGSGADRFSARDDTADRIDCGPGEDVVVTDRRDEVDKSCEYVYETARETPDRPPNG
jgi:hypothetical protein